MSRGKGACTMDQAVVWTAPMLSCVQFDAARRKEARASAAGCRLMPGDVCRARRIMVRSADSGRCCTALLGTQREFLRHHQPQQPLAWHALHTAHTALSPAAVLHADTPPACILPASCLPAVGCWPGKLGRRSSGAARRWAWTRLRSTSAARTACLSARWAWPWARTATCWARCAAGSTRRPACRCGPR